MWQSGFGYLYQVKNGYTERIPRGVIARHEGATDAWPSLPDAVLESLLPDEDEFDVMELPDPVWVDVA